MQAVVNRIRLKSPIDAAVFAVARRDIPPRAAEIEGLQAFHVLRVSEDELVVLVIGDSEEALDRMRAEVGNAWMRENVVPHAAAPPERVVGEAVVSFQRS